MLEPRRQRGLQLGLRRRIGELRVLVGERRVGGEVGLQLLARGLDLPLELLATCCERAQLELHLLELALERAVLVARRVERAARGAHRLVELGLPLLRDAEPGVERVETALAFAPSRRELGELVLERGALAAELLAPLARLLGELAKADQLEVLAMRVRLQLRRFALARGEVRAGIGARRLGAHQARPRLLADQRLRSRLALQVLDLLGSREEARLLGIGRVEGDRELAHRVFARHDTSPCVRFARARAQRRGRFAV